MVVIEERNELIQCINEYLDGKIQSFEFDEKLGVFSDSKDSTVNHIVHELWFFYDDLVDHHVCADKSNWDYWQRLILILASGVEIEEGNDIETTDNNGLSKIFALISLAVYGYLILTQSESRSFWKFVLWIVSIVICYEQQSDEPTVVPRPDCYPFSNYSEIRKAVRLSGNSKKKKFPREIEGRRIREKSSEIVAYLAFLVGLFYFSPIFLLIQVFQPNAKIYTVRFPQTPADI